MLDPIRTAFFLMLLFLQGCAGMYFTDAGEPPATPRYNLDQWPYREYWTGIVFSGNKIGFSHLHIGKHETSPDTYLIRSEASLHFHFLTLDKKVKLLAEDWINPDLTLQRFRYDYDMDGNRMRLSGEVVKDELIVQIETAAGSEQRSYKPEVPLYPASIINLYPSYHGLEPGKEYRYTVFNGETQRLTAVNQRILGYETSELFDGAAFKVHTRMHGSDVTTWINLQAEPVLEISMNGIFIAGLENEWMAKRYLAYAALNKDETLLNFSLIRTNRTLELPRQAARLAIKLQGANAIKPFPSDARQQCMPAGKEILCRIAGSRLPIHSSTDTKPERYLGSTVAVPARHPRIRELAEKITADTGTDPEKVQAMLDWLDRHIEPEVVDVFSALDVLDGGKAECQGYSFLFASLARSIGIPTRVVNGIVYSEEYDGFLYHTWVESLLDGQWQAIDPTFGQLHADATHIKLVEGDNLADLAPLLNVVGRLSAEIIAAEFRP